MERRIFSFDSEIPKPQKEQVAYGLVAWAPNRLANRLTQRETAMSEQAEALLRRHHDEVWVKS